MKTAYTPVSTLGTAILVGLTLLFVQAANAQFVTLTASSGAGRPSSQTLNVATNQLATVVHLNTSSTVSGGIVSDNSWLEVVANGVTNTYSTGRTTGGGNLPGVFLSSNLPIIAGPASLRVVSANVTAPASCTVQVITPTSSFVPLNAVVIPNDNGAPVQVILESSMDMVSWTPANPGTYGTSAANRFFRVRTQR